MLVSMIFQTLYILVDLFWVGRLGTDAIAAVGLAGNLSFIVIAITQVLSVGATTLVSHAAGRKDQDRAIFLFNQSQVLSMVVAIAFLAIAMLTRHQYAAEPERQRRHARRHRAVPAVVHPGDGVAVCDGGDGRGASRHRQLQARHAGADRHGRHQHGDGAVPDFRLGPVPRNGRERRRGRDVRVDRGWRRLDLVLLHRREGLSAFSFRPLETAAPCLVGDAQDRPAGRGRVRADGRLHGGGLRDHQAVWRSGAGRLHDWLARRPVGVPADRGAGLCGRAGGGTELRGRQGRSRARGLQDRGGDGRGASCC